jgi:hypothetical protein
MVATIQTRRSSLAAPPANGSLAPGQLALLMGPTFQLWAGVDPAIDGSGRKLLIDASNGPGPYLPLAGGALTGPLTLAANPATALHAASKGYVDAAAAFNVELFAWRDGSRAFTAVQNGVAPPDAASGGEMVTTQWARARIAELMNQGEIDISLFVWLDGSRPYVQVVSGVAPPAPANGREYTTANWVRLRIGEAIGPLIEELSRRALGHPPQLLEPPPIPP